MAVRAINNIKQALLIFNVVFMISGIINLSAGALALHDVLLFYRFAEKWFVIATIGLIGVGVIILFSGMLGSYGLGKDNCVVIFIFGLFILFVMVAQILIGSATVQTRNSFDRTLWKNLKVSMLKYHKYAYDLIDTWNNIQEKYDCCGADGALDWVTFGLSEPNSCCKLVENSRNCSFGKNIEGCYSKLRSVIHRDGTIIIAVAISFAIIQVFGMILACALAYKLKLQEIKDRLYG